MIMPSKPTEQNHAGTPAGLTRNYAVVPRHQAVRTPGSLPVEAHRINGRESAKRQASHAGIGFTELSNGLTATADLAALQQICDRLGPGVINVFVQRWLALLPQPFTDVLRALIADNLDLGRPHNVEIIFNRRIRRDTQGTSAPTLLNGLFIETPLAA